MTQASTGVVLQRARAGIDILQTISSEQSPETTVVRIHDVLTEMIPCDRFTFGLQVWGHRYRVEEGRVEWTRGLQIVDEKYSEPAPDGEVVASTGRSASLWVIQNRQPLLRKNISEELRFEHDDRRVAEGMLSDLIVPIVVGDGVAGTFNFTSRAPDIYTEEHLETAVAVADGVAAAARLFEIQRSKDSLEEQVTARASELEQANLKLKEEIAQRAQVEEELRDNESLLRSTIEATGDGILVVGANDRVILCNDRFKTLWQLPDHLFGSDSEKMLTFVKPQMKDPEAFERRL